MLLFYGVAVIISDIQVIEHTWAFYLTLCCEYTGGSNPSRF